MAEARHGLLDAALSYQPGSENRLTELFATVLATNDEFAANVMTDAGLPVGDRFEVLTQWRLPSGRRPDMVVRSTRNGHRVSELWSEHKTTSTFSAQQREDYARALAAEPTGSVAFMTITPEAESPPDERWHERTWQSVAALAHEVGFEWGQADWRATAMKPDAPAMWRVLQEFLWYLEQEGFAVMQPLTSEDLFVMSRLRKTLAGVDALLWRTAVRVDSSVTEKDIYDDADFTAWYFAVAHLPGLNWLTRFGGWDTWCETAISADGTWSPRGAGAPAVGSGYTLDKRLHAVLSSNEELVEKLAAAGYDVVLWGNYVRVWRTEPLATFFDAGPLLDDQAKALAAWVKKTYDDLGPLDPGEMELPDAPESAKRRWSAKDEGEEAQ